MNAASILILCLVALLALAALYAATRKERYAGRCDGCTVDCALRKGNLKR